MRKMHLTLLFTLSCMLYATLASAQPASFAMEFEKRKQAALNELQKYPRSDTHRVKALIKVLSTATFKKEREAVAPYLEEAFQICRSLDYKYGLAICLGAKGSFYKSASDYTNALAYYDSVLYVVGESNDLRMIEARSLAFQRKGMIFQAQENYYPALNNFFNAIKYTRDSVRILAIRVFITESYTSLNNFDKALEYARLNIDYIQRHPKYDMDASVYYSAINIFLEKNQLDSVEFYLEKVAPHINDPSKIQVRFGYFMKKGHIEFKRQRYTAAFDFYKSGLIAAKEGGHSNSISTALYFLSAAALKLGNTEAAKAYALDNLALVDSTNTKAGRIEALVSLSKYYHATKDDAKAFETLQESVTLKDSLLAETNIRQINLLGAIYEHEMQQREIARLQTETDLRTAELKQKATLNKLFLISIIGLLIVGCLGFAYFKKSQQLIRNKEALHKQKINELEKDKHLLSIDAMLKGQEEERNRIAKDLHDGLGSLLSGTKLSFLSVKEKVQLSPEARDQFEKSLRMLDNTIADLRKIAQNLLPEALVKYGLPDALRDFCDTVYTTTGIKAYFQQYGEMRTLESTATVFIFRIIQELVNNVVKHADATQVIVQLSFSEESVGITVEDNGKGIDEAYLLTNRGAGINNVQYRVQYLNGKMDIDTYPGGGTSVNIQLNI